MLESSWWIRGADENLLCVSGRKRRASKLESSHLLSQNQLNGRPFDTKLAFRPTTVSLLASKLQGAKKALEEP